MENKPNTDKIIDENKSIEESVLTHSAKNDSVKNNNIENDNAETTSTENDDAIEQSEETPATVKPRTNKELIAYLTEKFPLCFSIKGAIKPLKIGIFQELAEKLVNDENVSKTRLRQILRHYTSSWRYLKSIKLGAQRINLQGDGVEKIDQAQADYASKTLQESQEKFGYKKDKSVNKTMSVQARDKLNTSTAKKTSNEHTTKNKSRDKSRDKTTDKRDDAKFKGVKTSRNTIKKPEIKLEKIDPTVIKVGQAVKVKLGNAPMDALVKELSGNDVSVELISGMVVKTTLVNLYTQVVLEKKK